MLRTSAGRPARRRACTVFALLLRSSTNSFLHAHSAGQGLSVSRLAAAGPRALNTRQGWRGSRIDVQHGAAPSHTLEIARVATTLTSISAPVKSRRAKGSARSLPARRRPIGLVRGTCVAVLLLLAAVSGPSGQTPRVMFGPTTLIDLGIENPIGHVVADFNQDGHADLIVTPSINVFTGDGMGSFAPARRSAFADASAVATGDFTGDGTLDLAITQAVVSKASTDLLCGSAPSVGVFVGPNLSHSPPCLLAGGNPIAVQAADFDADGRTDLAIVSGVAQGLRIFKGQGDGRFAQVMTGETGGAVPGSFLNATAMAPPVDLDGNGTFDLVVAHAGGVRIFLGNGDGTFRNGGSAGSGNATRAVAVGDLNADGRPDIASVESTDGRLLVAFALGGGTFSTQAIATIGADLTDVVIADIDRDGRADILVAHEGGGTVRIFFGNGDGTFVANPPLALSVKPKFLVVRDWDEDGDVDLGIIDASVGGANAVLWIVRQDRPAPADTTPPMVALIPPSADGRVIGTVAVTAMASDDIGVTQVEFYAGANLIAKSAGPNYMVSWNTAAVPVGPVTLTARAFDAALNVSAWSMTEVTVEHAPDTTPPVVSVPANATVEATGPAGSMFPLGQTPVTCPASDTRSNSGTASFTVTVADTTPPTVTVPASVSIEATGRTGAPHTFTASATDTLDGVVGVTCLPASGSTFPLGATTATCASTDAHGNTGSASFSVIVVDTTAPAVTPPAPLTVAATQGQGARGNVATSAASQSVRAFLAGGSAIDGGDGAPVRQAPQAVINASTLDATADTLFPVGTTSVMFRFRDASGNIGSASSLLTVTAPVGGVVDSANQPVVATNSQNAPQPVTVSFATVTQPGLITADGIAAPAPPPAGFTFAGGGVLDIATTALYAPPIEVCLLGAGYTAADRLLHYENGAWLDVTASPTRMCATVSSLSPFAVITAVNHAPTADAGAPQTVEATSAAGATVTLTGTGSDPDPGDTLSFRWTEGTTELGTSPIINVGFPIGAHNIGLTVTDTLLASATSSTAVTVRDTTAPVLTLPANQTLEAANPTGVAFPYTSSATDTVDGGVAVSCTPASGATFPFGPTTVTCTATDSHANVGTKSFTVTVTDTTGPVVTVPANATVEATSAAGAAYTYTASATDLLDGSVATSCTPASGSTFPFGPTTVTCTATDSHANVGTKPFTGTVSESPRPVVNMPANATVEAPSAAGATFTYP